MNILKSTSLHTHHVIYNVEEIRPPSLSLRVLVDRPQSGAATYLAHGYEIFDWRRWGRVQSENLFYFFIYFVLFVAVFFFYNAKRFV